MAKVWVLDTSTKGTGARMVPLDEVLEKRSEHAESLYVPPPSQRKPVPPAAPAPPRSFKVLDIVSGQTISEGVDAKGAIEALNQVRSLVDVDVYVWQPESDRWRRLTFGEKRLLWELRGQGSR